MVADITLTPNRGEYGTSITVEGTGFIGSASITITYDGITVGTTTTDGSGVFNTTITPPNYVYDENAVVATDGTNSATATFTLLREPQYCTVKDVADWLRITINANSDPNTEMVKDYIISNEDDMDITMGHTFLPERRVREVFDVNRMWDWGRGQPLLLRHRNIKPFDATKGDKLEVWNGNGWTEQNRGLYFDEIKGTAYMKGYMFTILEKSRFRITYRYGGNNEMQTIPKDIKRCAVLMTALNILETDFQMSQIPYGGEGNVDKDKIMTRWQKKIDSILKNRSELTTVW
jgi:hypothetical protein